MIFITGRRHKRLDLLKQNANSGKSRGKAIAVAIFYLVPFFSIPLDWGSFFGPPINPFHLNRDWKGSF